jgi:hypothetical protein
MRFAVLVAAVLATGAASIELPDLWPAATLNSFLRPLQAAMGLRGSSDSACEDGVACKPCCAGYGDGSYGSNLTLLASAGQRSAVTVGTVFADASAEKHIVWAGSHCPEKSKVGAYLYRGKREDGEPVEEGEDARKGPIMATLWGPKKCKTVRVPAKCMKNVPTMCFGRPQSPLNRVLDEWAFDDFTSIRAYGSQDGKAAALVSKRTCMPFAFAAGSEGGNTAQEGSPDLDLDIDPSAHIAEQLLAVDGDEEAAEGDVALGLLDAVASKKKKAFLGIIFQNGTYEAPGGHVFSPPSRCKDSMLAL